MLPPAPLFLNLRKSISKESIETFCEYRESITPKERLRDDIILSCIFFVFLFISLIPLFMVLNDQRKERKEKKRRQANENYDRSKSYR